MNELSAGTLDYGREVMTAILGVDALYRAESGDATGLAVLNMDVSNEFSAEPFPSYTEAAERWTALREKAAGLSEPDRRIYYDQLAHSTLAFIRWRSTGLDFESQLGDFLHVPVAPASDGEMDLLRSGLRALLGPMGYNGDLAHQCASWEDRNRVPPDEVEGVSRELMAEAWDLTNEHVIEIPADRSDGMSVEAVTGVPFNARCNYSIRKVELNVEPTLTLPGLRHLAVHEGYPGHYLQFKLREAWYREGTAPADNLLSVVNTASSSVFEGIADSGLAVLGWDTSDDDRVQSLMTRYRAAIGTGAAWRRHALDWTRDATTDWLRGQALTGGEGWVQNRMAFIEAPSRAALIWSYWCGEPAVAPHWARVTPERRADFVRYLYGRMHSNRTVEMFDS
ncbi:MAG: hypothetical protein O2958_03160 [Gemmatimonadetes bacterium]|nr:hypothetical protein [Gemmatimonadota bacterium]MDA1102317.1 hypothetical protein [Gemmatimonadota bacterium]